MIEKKEATKNIKSSNQVSAVNSSEFNSAKKSNTQKPDTIPIFQKWSANSPHIINLKDSKKQKPVREVQTAPTREVFPQQNTKLGMNFSKDNKKVGARVSSSQKSTQLEPVVEDVFAKPTIQQKIGFSISRQWYKPLVPFCLIATMLVLPLQGLGVVAEVQSTKDRVLTLSEEAIVLLTQGKDLATSLDLAGASTQFDKASANFTLAHTEVQRLNSITTEIIKLLPGAGDTFDAGVKLLEAGEAFSDVGSILARAGNHFMQTQGKDYYYSLEQLEIDLTNALNRFAQAEKLLQEIDGSALPNQYSDRYETIVNSVPIVKQTLLDSQQLMQSLLHILGKDQWQRYLVLFANNHELRGSAGFTGSFALVDIDRGKIKNIEIPGGGTYDLQGGLQSKLEPPYPLQVINDRWYFHDANYWPDFPTSAKKIQWFYEQSGGPSTDGVIIITAKLMAELIDIIGPIHMPEYNRSFTGENFITEAQIISQVEYKEYNDGENTPKQFIADLAPKVLDQVFNATGQQFKQIIATLQKGLNQKHLLLYFVDQNTQDLVMSLDWGGALKQTKGDFLSVVHTNIAGGKTDEVITENLEHYVTIQDDGTVEVTLDIIRQHNGKPDDNRYTGVANNSYVRIYTPYGSQFISAEGFADEPLTFFESITGEVAKDVDMLTVETNKSIDELSGTRMYTEKASQSLFTVFGNWLHLKPGHTQKASITYKLPFKVVPTDSQPGLYSLLVQKQTGSSSKVITTTVTYPEQYKKLTTYPVLELQAEGQMKHSVVLNTDQFLGITFTSQ